MIGIILELGVMQYVFKFRKVRDFIANNGKISQTKGRTHEGILQYRLLELGERYFDA